MSRAVRLFSVFVVLLLAFAWLLPPGTAATASTGPAYAPDRVIVRFRPAAAAADRELARSLVGGQLRRAFDLVPGLESVLVPAGSVTDAIARLKQLPFVQYAEPDYIVYATVIPNDPSYGQLWGMTNIKAPAAWDIYTGDASFVVADIDTGVNYTHPDLAANMWKNPGEVAGDGIDNDGNGYVDDIYGYDFAYNDSDPSDLHGHGTHTSGTVGAVGNNGVGVTGVNWNVKLMALKFLNDSGSGNTSDAIEAVNYAAAKGVKISNNSWGGGGFDQGLYDAINAAKTKGHLFIAAAGNNYGNNNDSSPFYPASYNLDNIISVAAINSSDQLASFSNIGPTSVDLAAPGESIYSTYPGGYTTMSGTSMATPHVSGVAALLYGLHPDWTYQQVRDRLFTTVRALPGLSGKIATGGTLDAAAALSGATPPPTPTPSPTTTPPTATSHLGNLVGASSSLNNNYWRASVTVTVHNASHEPVSSAKVTGNWGGGTSGTQSCTTGSTGQCTMTTNLSKRRVGSVTYTVTNITHASLTYSSSSNDVSATVTITRP